MLPWLSVPCRLACRRREHGGTRIWSRQGEVQPQTYGVQRFCSHVEQSMESSSVFVRTYARAHKCLRLDRAAHTSTEALIR